MSYSEDERDPVVDDYERERLRLTAEVAALTAERDAARKQAETLAEAIESIRADVGESVAGATEEDAVVEVEAVKIALLFDAYDRARGEPPA